MTIASLKGYRLPVDPRSNRQNSALTLGAEPRGLTWTCSARGRPFKKESFGNEVSQAARQAGTTKSAHGVRKIAATIAAENGATVHELMALFGWTTIQQAEVYTREAERARLSTGAVQKLDEPEHLFPHLLGWCGPQAKA
jgi:integrase